MLRPEPAAEKDLDRLLNQYADTLISDEKDRRLLSDFRDFAAQWTAEANKLIELNKPFTMMAYPNRTHSISEGKNTTRHLFGLLTRYLNDNLPAGPKP